ncbi:MAG: hypothetical protein QGF34_02045 [Candidatus Poseidoniaceae archaeon]|jgi:hypothetical protein|nr:hypothetical protein [Candidatus Poseidoniaceae archaeon]
MTETLLLRNEIKGSAYPMILEKIVFISAIVAFVYLNQYLWSSTDEIVYQWVGTVALALSMLILTEIIGRIMQSIRASK